MDFIVMLIIFGVISALGKNSKKQPQNRKQGTSSPQYQRPQNTSASTRPRQTTLSSPKNRESLQDSLTTIFNALAGEAILKSPEEKRREDERAKRFEEGRRLSTQKEQFSTPQNETVKDSGSLGRDAQFQGLEDDLKLLTIDEEITSEAGYEFELDLEDAIKGIIWSEILDKPLSLRK